MLAKLEQTQPVGIPSHALPVQLFYAPKKTQANSNKKYRYYHQWDKPTNQKRAVGSKFC